MLYVWEGRWVIREVILVLLVLFVGCFEGCCMVDF